MCKDNKFIDPFHMTGTFHIKEKVLKCYNELEYKLASGRRS